MIRRLLRGGSYYIPARPTHTWTDRIWYPPESRCNDFGFRLVIRREP